jgi:PEP-CTERM motif
MKLRLLICTTLLALLAAPAFADSLSFTNKGGLSASSSGISANSTMTSFSVDGTLILSGKIGGVSFDTGTLTGSLNGGTFSGGDFSFGLFGPDGKTIEGAIFVDNFTGALTKIGKDLYDLVGTFSGIADGVAFKGTTDQIFSFGGDDDHGRRHHDDDDCWKNLHGTTTITAAAVPEPSTLTFFGTGLIALAGAVRRKLATRG